MGDDPVLYRTFIPFGRLIAWSTSRPVDQSGHVTRLGTEVAPFVTGYYVHKERPPRGSPIAE
jgi:hypothetical protein